MYRLLASGLVGIALAAKVALPVGDQGTPVALTTVPVASDCDVDPRSLEGVLALVDNATPVPGFAAVASEADLPQGSPADAATVAAVTAVEVAFVACVGAGDWPRVLALMTDDAVLRNYPESPKRVAELFGSVGTPPVAGVQYVLVAVRDVRLLSDGRIGAVVELGVVDTPGPRTIDVTFHILREVAAPGGGTRLLLDEEIEIAAP